MAALRLTVSIIFPSTRGFTPENRAAVQGARRQAAADLRAALNDIRRKVRAEGPRRTGQLRRSARVRRERAIEPGAITLSLTVNRFWASFTNDSGATAGWWDRAIDGIDIRLEIIGRDILAKIGEVFLREQTRALIRGLRRALPRPRGNPLVSFFFAS